MNWRSDDDSVSGDMAAGVAACAMVAASDMLRVVCVDSVIGSGSAVTGLAGICILLMASES
ncbi:TPA: hypothetical protein ACRZEE_004914 [Escherichia coli]